MTPEARLQASLELLDAIHAATAPADRTVAAYFRARRYVGAKDRAAISDLAYAVLRHRARLDWWAGRAADPRAASLKGRNRSRIIAELCLSRGWQTGAVATVFSGGKHGAAALSESERVLADDLSGRSLDDPAQPLWVRGNFPEWVEPPLREALGGGLAEEVAALNRKAPLDLRVNTLKATREAARAALSAQGVTAVPTPLSPVGLRVNGKVNLAVLPAFRDGLVEVQDEGSQLVALLVGAAPGMRICDFCAGAGGKTLAIAAGMDNRGHIVACDVLAGRLDRSADRLRRAGVHNVRRQPLEHERDRWVKRHGASFDRVLVDAPCSGTGTWRRNPDAPWRLDPSDLRRLCDLQDRILASAARLVRPGGRLVYATCSLLPVENAARIEAFLAASPDFSVVPVGEVWAETVATLPDGAGPGAGPGDAGPGDAGPGRRPCPVDGPFLALTPGVHGTDGFFAAVLQRAPAAPRERPPPDAAPADDTGPGEDG